MSAVTALVSVLTSLLALGLALGQLTPTGRSMKRLESLSKLIESGHDDVKSALRPIATREAQRLAKLSSQPPSPVPTTLIIGAATVAMLVMALYTNSLTGQVRSYWEGVAYSFRYLFLGAGTFFTLCFLLALMLTLLHYVRRSDIVYRRRS